MCRVNRVVRVVSPVVYRRSCLAVYRGSSQSAGNIDNVRDGVRPGHGLLGPDEGAEGDAVGYDVSHQRRNEKMQAVGRVQWQGIVSTSSTSFFIFFCFCRLGADAVCLHLAAL
jgi:hypothetical protein